MILPLLIMQFDAMTREQILELRPGEWSDEEILEALKYFESEKKDRNRAMAVAELILRSPQMGNIDYYMMYLNLNGYYRWKGDFPAALRWVRRAAQLSKPRFWRRAK